jgi:WD40 repeat protein
VIATCSNDMTVKLWQPSEVDEGRWTNSATLSGHLGTVSGVTFSPKGLPLMLASGSADGTVRLWTAEMLEEEGNAYKWTCAQILGNMHVRQKLRRRGKKIQASGHRDEVKAVAFRKKGEVNLLASGSMDETVRIWGLKTKDAEISEEVRSVQLPHGDWIKNSPT